MIRRLLAALLFMAAVIFLARWGDRLHLIAAGLAVAVGLALALGVAALRSRSTRPEWEGDVDGEDAAAGDALLRDGLFGVALGACGLALTAAIYSYALPPFYPLLIGDCPQLVPKLAIYEEAQAWSRAVALIDDRLSRPIDRACRAELAERKARDLIEWSKTLSPEQAQVKLQEAERWAEENNLPNYRAIAQLTRQQLEPTPTPRLVTPTAPPRPTPRALPAGTTAQLSGIDAAYFPPTIFAYLRVLDGAGQPVTGLAASDIRVLDDGKPVSDFSLASFSQSPAPISAALVVDCSGSMAGQPLAAARAGARAFVDLLGPKDAVELIGFSDKAQVLQSWTGDRAAIGQSLDLLTAKDWTALWDALWLAGGDLAGRPGRKVVVVLSDGGDNRSQHTREEVADQARRAGLGLFVIGLRSEEYDGAALQALVQSVGGRYAEAAGPDELESYYREMAGTIRNEYRLALTLSRPPDHGTHRLRVELGGPRPLAIEQTYQDP